MPQVRSLLLGLDVRLAGKMSHCARNKAHVITKGQPRFVVRPPGAATGEKGYCLDCAEAMLNQLERDTKSWRQTVRDARVV